MSSLTIPNNFIPQTKFTVVIAARNEERTIVKCINSVLDNNYPKNLFDLIVVNDHSTDNTKEILNSIRDERLTILNLTDSQGKKNAIETAILKAKGDHIACTDADCYVSKTWLLQASYIFETTEAKFIAAPIICNYDRSIVQRFQALDTLNNMCMTAAGISSGLFHLANGANMFFEKDTFIDLGGYTDNRRLASGDDVFLIQKIAAKFPDKVIFAKSLESAVTTGAEATLAALIHQRIRWATKSKFYANRNLNYIQSLVFCFTITIVINFGLALFGFYWAVLGFFISLSCKWVLDYFYLKKLTQFFNNSQALRSFIPASIAFIIYIIFAGWKALIPSSYNWKGRQVN